MAIVHDEASNICDKLYVQFLFGKQNTPPRSVFASYINIRVCNTRLRTFDGMRLNGMGNRKKYQTAKAIMF